MLPTKNQWSKWSLPDKYTTIGFVVGVFGVAFSLFTYFLQPEEEIVHPVNDSHVRELFGFWETTSIDESFAEARNLPKKVDETFKTIAPSFDLNSDGSARMFISGTRCTGTWFVYNNIVDVECPGYLVQLERKGNILLTLPNREFTLEKQ